MEKLNKKCVLIKRSNNNTNFHSEMRHDFTILNTRSLIKSINMAENVKKNNFTDYLMYIQSAIVLLLHYGQDIF